ncbi:unnamed protein product [Moneuplotes crassus]|uniref:ACB domain-containing protein n=1 Tax=Euplotes crassus TaxID=5936 RepID=A0AAD1XKT7_EUPCR|nr:unnamed protein product [Moneuplotes crassus]
MLFLALKDLVNGLRGKNYVDQEDSEEFKAAAEKRVATLNDQFKDLNQELQNVDEGDPSALEELFTHCAASVQNLTLEGKLKQEDLLELYGFFKQAMIGDATDKYAPSLLDLKGKAKFNVWRTNLGITQEDAKKYYILKYASLNKEAEENVMQVLNGEIDAQEVDNPAMKSISRPEIDQKEVQNYIGALDEDKTRIFNLYEEIRANGEEELYMVIERKEISAETTNKEGMTPFMLAVDEAFSVEILQTLLDFGADINHRDNDGSTALHYACTVSYFTHILACGRRDHQIPSCKGSCSKHCE